MLPLNLGGEIVDSLRIRILNDIYKERDRQNKLHPEKLELPMRFVTISEEIGEIAQALQDNDMESIGLGSDKTMQYTLIVDLETANSQAGDEKYLFKNFGKPSDLISYVSNI